MGEVSNNVLLSSRNDESTSRFMVWSSSRTCHPVRGCIHTPRTAENTLDRSMISELKK